jgi:hypothetical protein
MLSMCADGSEVPYPEQPLDELLDSVDSVPASYQIYLRKRSLAVNLMPSLTTIRIETLVSVWLFSISQRSFDQAFVDVRLGGGQNFSRGLPE